jgi:chromosome segregation ATPase
VYDSHGEERRIQNKYQLELKAATAAEKSAEREKQLAITLEEQAKEHQQALITLDKNLTAARKQLVTLEDQKKTMLKEVAEALDGAEQARSKIAKLSAEVAKRRQDALVGLLCSLIATFYIV